MLVFLSPVPIDEDEGRIAALPDGQNVDLREAFRASGCYEIGSNTPLWTAPWDNTDGWIVSDDCRYLVRWNVFGDGKYGRGGDLNWGLKFYDNGREIKNYDVAELVDYPSLMPETSSDWHYMWIGDSEDSCTIEGGQFIVETSTHERYRFDLGTGAIVQERRVWRHVARAGIALFTTVVVGLAVFIIRRQKRTSLIQSTVDYLPQNSERSSNHSSKRIFSFSLRTLLLVTSAVAVLCLVVPRWPHIVLLLSTVLIALLCTRAMWRFRRTCNDGGGSGHRRVGFVVRAFATGLSWCCCYVLSVAPVLTLVEWLQAPSDVRMAIILTVYRPLVWISKYVSLDGMLPLDWYFNAWGI
jgi:hypothetical protein